MPINHIKHAINAGNKHGPLFVPVVFILIIFSLAFFCASVSYFYRLLCINRRRSRRDVSRQRYLPVGLRDTRNTLYSDGSNSDDDGHIWDPEEVRLVRQQRNAKEKELELNKKVKRMKKQLNQYESALNTARDTRVQLTSRLNTSRENKELITNREIQILSSADQKGRNMYGKEAWDNGIDGGPPLKMLLSLEKNEIEYVKQGVLTARRDEIAKKQINIDNQRHKIKSSTSRKKDTSHDAVYGVNNISLNIKYDNEIGDKYVGHHDTISTARHLTERLKRHNNNKKYRRNNDQKDGVKKKKMRTRSKDI
jgi:hypothetical protein